MARSLNKILLIGNLTRDPEMRFTPQGTAVCSFGIATNRQWKTDTGETREEAEFFRIVSWNKLAEICNQMLHKGNRAYVEGRLQTRNWTGNDGVARTTIEVVISDMILLDSKGRTEEINVPEEVLSAEMPSVDEVNAQSSAKNEATKIGDNKKKKASKQSKTDEEDLPF